MIAVSRLKETVAARWKNKKDKYRRELKQVPVLRSGAPADHYKSNWPYFDMMSFLKDLLIPGVKSGNLPSLDESSQVDENICDLEGDKDDETDTQSDMDTTYVNSPPSVSVSREERPLSSASASSSISQHRKGKTRKRIGDVREGKFLEIENKKLNLLTQHLKNDAEEADCEELLFFKSLIPYMKNFNQIQRLKLRSKIQTVISDELESAENNKSKMTRATTAQNNNLQISMLPSLSPTLHHLLPSKKPSHHHLISPQNSSLHHLLPPENPNHNHLLSPKNSSLYHLLPPENPSHHLLSLQNPSPHHSTVSRNPSTSSTPFSESNTLSSTTLFPGHGQDPYQ
ncbi:uncharacterized protein LOC116163943 [Photinus pyralis]|uniref:uncharacterized protein LOC116163943 n=1 Tax=Photinus pyralis TaxID=7054 RepID=UPI00126723B4|nr:uncharacterized protein LOC116163943 [Photinus pyralis]